MKIVRLKAENIKKLVAVEITPAGNVIKITGKNGAGKTSVLDAIQWGLAGAESIPRRPVRIGQKKGAVELDFGDIIVRRTFTDEGATTLTIENKEGARFKSPQAMLDKFIGRLSFDPLEFSRMDARAQYDTLRRFVPGVDFDAIDNANRQDYEARTALGRQLKQVKAAAETIELPEIVPAEHIDESALIAELEEAGRQNADIATRTANRQRMREEIDRERNECHRISEEISKLEQRIAELKESREQHVDRGNALAAKLDAAPPLPAVIDTQELRQRIDEAKSLNHAYDLFLRREALRMSADALDTQIAALTMAMEQRDADTAAAIAAANLPISGLAFGAGELFLNEVPLSQASAAEQLRVSLAMAMALNPKLRVIRVTDGSLLDSASMAVIEQMASSGDYQVWIEMVDESGKVGVVIEDGHVAAVNQAEEATT